MWLRLSLIMFQSGSNSNKKNYKQTCNHVIKPHIICMGILWCPHMTAYADADAKTNFFEHCSTPSLCTLLMISTYCLNKWGGFVIFLGNHAMEFENVFFSRSKKYFIMLRKLCFIQLPRSLIRRHNHWSLVVLGPWNGSLSYATMIEMVLSAILSWMISRSFV